MYRTGWFIFSAFLLTACTKKDPSIAADASKSIAGRWELSVVIGGLAGYITYPPGNGITLTFQDHGRFRDDYPGASRSDSGSYEIQGTGLPSGVVILMRKYDGSTQSVADSAFVSSGQLILSQPPACCDIPYKSIYLRLP